MPDSGSSAAAEEPIEQSIAGVGYDRLRDAKGRLSQQVCALTRPLTALSRERLLVYAAVVLLILFRASLFVFNESIAFDSDQAVFGLMAKHLAEGRAFPLFMYGQNYILGVEAWMAAPVFLFLGASVAALKLPLLAVNIAVGLLLVTLLERQVGLRPKLALVASLFFILAPPGTAAILVAASGGNVEPFLYVVLLWMTRRRPGWFGLILAVGFLHREFTMYGAVAVLLVEAASGAWRTKEARQRLFSAARVAAEVYLVILFLRDVASASGPGTTFADLRMPGNNLVELTRRSCFDAGTLMRGVRGLITIHWPRLFGTWVLPVAADGIESRVMGGFAGASWLLGAAALLVVVRIVMRLFASPGSRKGREFSVYLVLVGALSAGVFSAARCGSVDITRYDLLSVLGAVGLTGWFLAVEPNRWLRRGIVGVVLVWAGLSFAGHAQIWAEYMKRPPVSAKTRIIRELDVRGIKYGVSDYWLSYYITFVTNERIIIAAEDARRILPYEQQVNSHLAEAVRISRTPCGVPRVFAGVYFCPLP